VISLNLKCTDSPGKAYVGEEKKREGKKRFMLKQYRSHQARQFGCVLVWRIFDDNKEI
jgi:ribosomal protein L33